MRIEAGGGAAGPGDVLYVEELDAAHLVPGEHHQLPLTPLPRRNLRQKSGENFYLFF